LYDYHTGVDATWDEDMQQTEDAALDNNCAKERWAFHWHEVYPPDPDYVYVYEHDPCGVTSCVEWDEDQNSYDVDFSLSFTTYWTYWGTLPIWDERNPLTKAYWDQYHANVWKNYLDEEGYFDL
jgi:hypothetical protein